ncbi:MFS monocarboxylate transporter-like protein [Halenospora varia]|nr:MFS monocarboxylate transporter-like protein [Halenospora varia]
MEHKTSKEPLKASTARQYSSDFDVEQMPSGPASLKDNGSPTTTAWLQCAGAFFLFLNSWGLINTFGAFQTIYQEGILRNHTPSSISWIGSFQSFLLFFCGLLVGPLFDAGHVVPLVYAGSFLIVFGMMMTSISYLYWHIFLGQGLLVGLGCACFFIPSVAILPLYFKKNMALAMGIAASGSSIGGVMYPILFQRILPQIGFGWATRTLAFVMLGTLMIPLCITKMPPSTTRPKHVMDKTVFKDYAFLMFALSSVFGFIGLYIPFYYIQLYSLERHLSIKVIPYLLPILNAGSFFGRIVPNHIADQIGSLNTAIVCTSVASLLGFVWIGIYNLPGVIVFCILYGFFSGSFLSLGPAVVAALSPNPEALGSRLSLLFLPASIGVLIGNPIAGALLESGWIGLQAFCGTCIAMSVLLAILARILSRGVRFAIKI